MLNRHPFFRGDFLINILKGIIIGIGKIMPGVSGALFAMNLGVYENAVYYIGNFFKKPLAAIKYLFPIVLGILIALVFMGKIINYCLNTYYLPTMLLFIGLIISTFRLFLKKIEHKKAYKYHYLVMFISFILVFLIERVKGNINLNSYIIIGFVDAITMIIPGLCGSALMMLLGIYDKYIELMANITNILYFKNIVMYGFGLLIMVILISKLVDYLMNKTKYTYSVILGFSSASLVSLFLSTLSKNYTVIQILVAYFFLLIGYFIGNIFAK